jgi:toxin ParE1/3/4
MAIVRRLQVIADLEEITDYLAQHSEPAALRFLDAAEQTIRFLEVLPLAGRLCRFKNPAMTGVRKRVINGFRKYLVYYRPLPDGVEVLRVIHGRRDTRTLLGEEFD